MDILGYDVPIELGVTELAIGFGMWLLTCIMIWKMMYNGDQFTTAKIAMTIIMLPASIIVTSMVMNK